MSYTQGMEWDPDKLKVDTLRPDDPKLRIGTLRMSDLKVTVGTISFDRIVKGELEWDDAIVAPLREQDFF